MRNDLGNIRHAMTQFVNLISRRRHGGSMRGKIWIADDFDAPDPEIEKPFVRK